jgi:heptosyltransferase-2
MGSFVRRLARRTEKAITSPQLVCAVGRPLYLLAGRRSHHEISLQNARAILVTCPDGIGNVVLATPFLRELRRNAPRAWITLGVSPELLNLVELCPYVNEVEVFDWRARGRAATLERRWRALRFAAARLWKRRFDLAVMPRWDADYYDATYFLYFSGAARRVSYSEGVVPRKQQGNAGFDRMLTDAVADTPAVHEVDQYLAVLRFLGGDTNDDRLELWLHQDDRAWARQLFAQHGLGREKMVMALGPGASLPKKCWPVERFVELGHALIQEYDARFVVVGGPQDSSLGARLENELGLNRVLNAAGNATLRQTASLLEGCSLMVSNDTGPLHLAAAAGRPVVQIAWHARGSPPTDPDSPARFYPWRVPHVVVQPERAAGACRDSCEAGEPHCILGIQPDQVLEAVHKLVRAGGKVQSEILRSAPLRSE